MPPRESIRWGYLKYNLYIQIDMVDIFLVVSWHNSCKKCHQKTREHGERIAF
jgi:hypothetical protein